MDKHSERRLLIMAAVLWSAAGIFAVVAGRITDGLPFGYTLLPFVMAIGLFAWSYKIGQSLKAGRSNDLPDAEPQAA